MYQQFISHISAIDLMPVFVIYLCIHLHTYVYVCVHAKLLSRVQLFVTPWTVTHQAPLSKGFSRQEYWSGLPCPSPGDLPNPGVKPVSLALQVDSSPPEPPGKPLFLWKNDVLL